MALLDLVAETAGKLILTDTTVTAVTPLGERFRRVDLRWGGRSKWAPGQKLQVRVRGLDLRTYTPFGWDGKAVSLLVLRQDEGLATRWVDALLPGQSIQAFGPRGAVNVPSAEPSPLFIGDETSLALAAASGATGAPQLYEVDDPAETTEVAAAIGVTLTGAELVARTAEDAHLEELTARAVTLVSAHPDVPVVLTGKAQTIRALRGALKDAGLSPTTGVKAHWDPRRKGLD